jgi:putative ABC transport system permease protein
MKDSVHAFFMRLWDLFRRRRLEAEMEEEMRTHFEALVQANRDSGMPEAEARQGARRRFGSMVQLRERAREEHGWVALEQWVKDARFAARGLIRAPGFLLSTSFTLVVGISVLAFVVLLTASVLFFEAPYPDAERLVVIGYKDQQGAFIPGSFAVRVQAFEEQANAFSAFAAVSMDPVNVVMDGIPVATSVRSVSRDCFTVLGVRPVLGRGFLPDEFKEGAHDVVVITDLFWRQRFQAAPDVIGRKLEVEGRTCTVVGVLSPGQAWPVYFRDSIYRPLLNRAMGDMGYPTVFAVGRLKPGVTREQAEVELRNVTLPTIPAMVKTMMSQQMPVVLKLKDPNRPDISWLILVAGVFLFLIACLNAMNLGLVRMLSREREIGIRLSLGGSRAQVARLLAWENGWVLLGVALVAAGVARWGFPWLLFALYGDASSLYLNYWTPNQLLCIAAATAVAGLFIAVPPIRQVLARPPGLHLKEGGTTASGSRRVERWRSLLVVTQAALAMILLVGTGLMIRTFQKLREVDLGFDPTGRVKLFVLPPRGQPFNKEAVLQRLDRIKARLAEIPGVRSVSAGGGGLLSGTFWGSSQLKMADGTLAAVAENSVDETLHQTIGLTLVKGRWLSGQRGTVEAVINETMARKRFGDEDPLGRSFQLQGQPKTDFLVVGVVRNVRENVRAVAEMEFYSSTWRMPPNSMVLRLARTPGKEFADQVRSAIYEVDPSFITATVQPMDDLVTSSMLAEHFALRILRSFTAVALVLAIVGLFSVIAHGVDARRKEFGVRLALGASPAKLRRSVLRRGLILAVIGVGAGSLASLGLTRFMRSLLFETASYDPLVYVGVAAVLLASAIVACWLPARRAAAVDVAQLLRNE